MNILNKDQVYSKIEFSFNLLNPIKLFERVLYVVCLIIICFSPFQNTAFSQNRIYFQTDRPTYFPGDTIWYKSYFTHKDQLDTNVKNMSLAIGRKNSEILENQLRPISKGVSYGQYIIPRDFKDYEIYFNVFTKRNIINGEIIDPMELKIGVFQEKLIKSESIAMLDIQVEGGGMVNHSDNLIRLKWNKNEKFAGSIKDEDGKELKSFTSDNLGQANVVVHRDDKKIFLHWSHDGVSNMDTIPNSKSMVRMRLKEISGNNYLFIDNQSKVKDLRLQFYVDNYKFLDSIIHFEKIGTDSLIIDKLFKGRFSGEFSIYENGNKLAQLQVDQILKTNPEITFEKLDFEKFAENEITLKLDNQSEWNGSISVYDGNLYSPVNWQYESNDFVSFESGKYQYSYLINDNYSNNPDFTDSVYTLSGKIEMKDDKWAKFLKIKDKRTSKLKKKEQRFRGMSFGYRLLTEANYKYDEIAFDTLGHIDLPVLTFYDTLETRFVQIDERLKLIDYGVDLKFSTMPQLNKLTISKYLQGMDISQKYTGNYDPDFYQYEFGNTELKPVHVSNRIDARKQMLRQKYSQDWFASHDSFLEIDMINYNLPSYVFSFDELITYLFHKYPKLRGINAIYLFNNRHANQGTGLVPEDVTEIEYIRAYEIYPQNKVGGGAIMFYTSGIDARNKDIGTANINIEKTAGYTKFYDFTSPDYKIMNKPKFDDRVTLLWIPDRGFKGSLDSKIKFYNNSMAKSYYVHVNLISKGGKFVSYQKKFE